MKTLGALFTLALMIISIIGFSGEGPDWTRWVGAVTLFSLLMIILTQTSNLPTASELKKILVAAELRPPAAMSMSDEEDAPRERVSRN